MHAGEDDKAALTERAKADGIAHESEPPLPPYSRAHPADSNGRLAAEQSVNWLNVSRDNESIRGTYAVDPYLDIPAALLALPSTEGCRGKKEMERMNLVLETKEGDIDVTVHIVGENGNADGLPGSSAEIEQKVKVKMRSYKGSVTCRIVPIDESNDLGQAVTRPRFIVYASADNGSANILLPRSFSGSISAFAGLSPSPRGPIELSPDLRRNARILMDTDRKRFFVGELTQFDKHSSWDAVNDGQTDTKERYMIYKLTARIVEGGITTLYCLVYTNNTHDFDEDEGESPPSVDDKPLLVDKEVAEATAEEETRVATTDDTEPIAEDEGLAVCDEGPAVPEAEGMAVDDPLIVGKDVEDTSMVEEPVAEGVFAVEEGNIMELVEASTEEEIAGVLDAAKVPEDKKVPGALESVAPVRSYQRANGGILTGADYSRLSGNVG
ncbi:hypothetical protein EYR40_002838 [Pleurotus pulmonarius]|nr:hypothetical protein EYR40_002838 [Pleurotus pulmonarius]